jgi:hypothetical protein
MPTAWTIPLLLALLGLLLLIGGLALVRSSGARPGLARRLAGAREVRVGELLDLGPADPVPQRPVRVVGRIRCADPIVTGQDDSLVAFHRDVEVALRGGGWRSIERLRETRSFELWDHDGSLTIDAAAAAEPLVVLPHVWRGPAADLDESYAPALARMAAEHETPRDARATTRMVSVIDRLLVLATVRRDVEGRVGLAAPPRGYVISSLELDDAMRLLGGPQPRRMLAGIAAVAASVPLLAAGSVLAVVRVLSS